MYIKILKFKEKSHQHSLSLWVIKVLNSWPLVSDMWNGGVVYPWKEYDQEEWCSLHVLLESKMNKNPTVIANTYVVFTVCQTVL
jgi:hypothetical protein